MVKHIEDAGAGMSSWNPLLFYIHRRMDGYDKCVVVDCYSQIEDRCLFFADASGIAFESIRRLLVALMLFQPSVRLYLLW